LVPVVLEEQLHLAVVVLVETQVFQRFLHSVELVVAVHDLPAQSHHRQPHRLLQMVELVVLAEHLVAVVAVAIQLHLHQLRLQQVRALLQLIQVVHLHTEWVVRVELHVETQQTLSVQMQVQTQVMVVAEHLPRVPVVTSTVVLVVQEY
jgi:hypothetical protein